MKRQVAEYLHWFREGNAGDAFHGLIEMDREVLPELEKYWRSETDGRVREFLLQVIGEHREPSMIPLLGEALFDPDPRVWRQAFDGLVSLATRSAVAALQAARSRQFKNAHETEEFRHWLEEAIEQAEGNTQRQ